MKCGNKKTLKNYKHYITFLQNEFDTFSFVFFVLLFNEDLMLLFGPDFVSGKKVFDNINVIQSVLCLDLLEQYYK